MHRPSLQMAATPGCRTTQVLSPQLALNYLLISASDSVPVEQAASIVRSAEALSCGAGDPRDSSRVIFMVYLSCRAALTPGAAIIPHSAILPGAAIIPHSAIIPGAAIIPHSAILPGAAIIPHSAITLGGALTAAWNAMLAVQSVGRWGHFR